MVSVAGRITPGTLRAAMRMAITDDLLNGQPELQHRRADREDNGSIRPMYEVRGYIDPAQLGTFGAQQLEHVIERAHPGLMAQVNGQRSEITHAELHALLDEVGLPGDPYHAEQATAILNLINARLRYTPSFDDL